MKATEFCYWLQGYFELQPQTMPLTTEQVSCIQRHLNLVFAHDIDPQAGSAAHQQNLSNIHGGNTLRC